MPIQTLHLRSNVQGKEPVPGTAAGQLPIGNIGINFNKDEPFLTIQDSAGAIRRIAGIKVGATEPASPTAGEAWLDTTIATKPVFKVHDGTAWQGAGSGTSIGSAAPATPLAGDLWVDTSVAGAPVLKVYNGTAFVAVTPDATTSAKGVVQLADAAAITGGTAGRVVDAAQLKAATPDASETVKGIVELATAAETTTGTDGTRAVHPAGLKVELDKKANLASPALTGTPTAPTAAAGTNTTQVATTAFVTAAVSAEDLWDRSGTEITPKTAGDSVFTSGAVKVGGTTAAPNITVKADGGIVANTNGLVYDAATKRLAIGTTSPSTSLHVQGGSGATAYATFAGNNNSADGFIIGQDVAGLTRLYQHSATPITFWTNALERGRWDGSGRLLVGTSTARANFANSTISAGIQLEGAGGLVPSQRFLSIVNNHATDGDGGGTVFLCRSKGATTGSNVLVGSTIGDQLGAISFQGNDGTEFVVGARIEAYTDGACGANDLPTRLMFSVTPDGGAEPVERMRIGNAGYTVHHAETSVLDVRTKAAANTSVFLIRGGYNEASANPAGGGGTASFFVSSNGNVTNTNNSFTGISDVKLKENIVDAGSQWADLKALRVRNYNLKEGQTHRQIGLVAQEVETVSPGLVYEVPDRDEEGNDLGTVTKGVQYSVLYMKAVKALQEAMERIETLEAKVAALEGPAPSKHTDPGVK